jgi:urea transporter
LALQRQLVGIGQIHFQASPVFGAMLLLCLYLNAPALAMGCAPGVCSASLAAWAMRLPSGERHNGIYSFNGALTGIGLCAGYRLDVGFGGWPLTLFSWPRRWCWRSSLLRVALLPLLASARQIPARIQW